MKCNYLKKFSCTFIATKSSKTLHFPQRPNQSEEFLTVQLLRVANNGCRRLEMKRRGRNRKSDTDRFLVWILPFHNSCPQRWSRWQIWAHSRRESAEQHLAKILITAAFMNWTTALFVFVICSLYHAWQSNAVRSASEGTSSYSQAHGVEQQ